MFSFVPSSRQVSNKTCLLVNTSRCFTLLFHSVEIKVSRQKRLWWSFDLDSNQASISSYFANVVFAIVAITITPQGNARGAII